MSVNMQSKYLQAQVLCSICFIFFIFFANFVDKEHHYLLVEEILTLKK